MGEDGRKETIANPNEKQAEGRDKTKNNGTKKDNKQDESLSKELKDAV